MFGVCLRYAKNRSDAQDLLHDGFVKVYTGLNEYKGNGSFEGWIRRIMVNTAINFYHRKAGKFFDLKEGEEDNSSPFNEEILEQMSTNELLGYINEMPDGYRLVFNMYVIEGYKHVEISELLGISEATSKTQFMKARRHLMKKVKQMAYENICREQV
jgi:RNA polymerase sigma-70 factor (ECF subfamily)